MSTPSDLRYTSTHEWIRQESDGTITIGITDHAQQQLGDVVFVEPPAPGRQVKKGEECAVVESVKAAADIYAPVSGEVVAANAELADAPEKVNQDPYGAWMFRIRPSDKGELSELLDSAAYDKVAAADDH